MAGDLNAVHLALRLHAKPALPAHRELENVPPAPVSPSDPYSEEDFVPATRMLHTVTASPGIVLITGLYVLRWFGVAGDGTAAMNAGIGGLILMFSNNLAIIATDGTVVVIGSPNGPNYGVQRGQITNLDNGRPVATVRIPWWFTAGQTF